jgi:hypothetical protein
MLPVRNSPCIQTLTTPSPLAPSVEACSSFRHFTIESGALIDVGGGITAEVISYRNPKRNSD